MGYLAGYEKVWDARDRVGESRGYAVLVLYPAKPSRPAADVSAPDPSAAGVVRKVLLPMTGPMVGRRVLVPSVRTLHELRGLTRATLSWKGIHLHRFCLHSRTLTCPPSKRPPRVGTLCACRDQQLGRDLVGAVLRCGPLDLGPVELHRVRGPVPLRRRL